MKAINLNKLSPGTQAALLAAVAVVAKPYEGIAASVAAYAEGAAKSAQDAKSGIWGQFKHALGIAQANEHSASTMRTALEAACAQAGVPSGTVRSYLPTLESLKADIDSDKITTAEAVGISIKDARARYKPEPTEQEKALKAARERLAEVTKDWTAEQIHLLCELAEGDADEEESEEEAATDTPEAITA